MSENRIEKDIEFTSYDGIELQGTLVHLEQTKCSDIVILIHGIGGDREENGFYTDLASQLLKSKIASFRYDWRCHGVDCDRPSSALTLSGLYNDIAAGTEIALKEACSDGGKVVLIAHSFSAAVTANWAIRNTELTKSVILLSPVLNYIDEYFSEKWMFFNGKMTEETRRRLKTDGVLSVQDRKFSRAMCNEMINFPDLILPHGPDFWIIHGEEDSSVSVEFSKKFKRSQDIVNLLLVPGAEHGFLDSKLPPDRGRTEGLWRAVSRTLTEIIKSDTTRDG